MASIFATDRDGTYLHETRRLQRGPDAYGRVHATKGGNQGRRICRGKDATRWPSNTTSTVKILEQAELVTRRRSKTSDREVMVTLTGDGRKIFRKCYPRILGEAHAHMAERLTRGEMKLLADVLWKLVR